eukprot:961493_1
MKKRERIGSWMMKLRCFLVEMWNTEMMETWREDGRFITKAHPLHRVSYAISQHYHYLKPHSEIITNGEALRTLYAIHTNHRRPIELVVIPSDNISLIPTPYPIPYNTNYPVIPGLQQPYQYQYRGMNQNQKRQLIHSIAIDTINQSSRYVTVQNPITRHPYWEWDNPFIDNIEFYPQGIRINSTNTQIIYLKRAFYPETPIREQCHNITSNDLTPDGTHLTLDSLLSYKCSFESGDNDFWDTTPFSNMDSADYAEFFEEQEMNGYCIDSEDDYDIDTEHRYGVPNCITHATSSNLIYYDMRAQYLNDSEYMLYLMIRYEQYQYTKPKETNHSNKAKIHTENSASPIITPPFANPKQLYTISLLIVVLLFVMMCLYPNIITRNRTESYQSTKQSNCTKEKSKDLTYKAHLQYNHHNITRQTAVIYFKYMVLSQDATM